MIPERSCIVVPCYNEGARFRTEAFLSFLGREEDMDLCFVNDGSIDDTLSRMQGLQMRQAERVHVVTYPDNRGKAEAVRRGMLEMTRTGRYAYVAFADADLATPLGEVVRLLRIAQSDPAWWVVMGSRIEGRGAKIRRKSYRHFTGRIFAWTVSIFFRLPAHDTQCGAKVFRASAVETAFGRPFLSQWLFDVEVLLRVRRETGNYASSIREEPLQVWEEQGHSKIRLAHLLRMPWQLCRIFWRYMV